MNFLTPEIPNNFSKSKQCPKLFVNQIGQLRSQTKIFQPQHNNLLKLVYFEELEFHFKKIKIKRFKLLHPKSHTKKKISFTLYFVFSSIVPQFQGHQTIQLNNKQKIINIRKEKSNIADVY